MLYGPLITSALRTWREHRLVLALDTSVLFENFCLIRGAVLFRGRPVPLYSTVIGHGSAQVSTAQLLPVPAHVKGILDFVGIGDVRLLADREFIGKDWFKFLRRRKIPICIRLKADTHVNDEPVFLRFQGMKPGQM